MDLVYLGITAVCVALSVWFTKFCHSLMEDKQ